MKYEEEYDHFHIVSICVECADISIIGLATNKEALGDFFKTLESSLEEASHNPLLPKPVDLKFDVTIVIPDQVATIIPRDGHRVGHVAVCVAHKCQDAYAFCVEQNTKDTFLKAAKALANSFMKDIVQKPQAKKNEDDRARKLFESIDLPDDLFKGFN